MDPTPFLNLQQVTNLDLATNPGLFTNPVTNPDTLKIRLNVIRSLIRICVCIRIRCWNRIRIPEPDLEQFPGPVTELFPELDLELFPNLKPDPELDLEPDSELDPDSELSHVSQRSKSLQIAKSVVALATGLPQLYTKLQNCQACGIPLANFY
jgi:hypothetical protein